MPKCPGSCPGCGRPVGRKDRLCTGCGRDLRTGDAFDTTVGEVRVGPGPLAWVWENLLGMLGCLVLTAALAAAFFLIARGDRALTGFYTLAVAIATCITVGLTAIAIARRDGLGSLLMSSEGWFWLSDSTDGRLKGVLAGLVVAAILIAPLRAALPETDPDTRPATTP